jgi:hypothetical protein
MWTIVSESDNGEEQPSSGDESNIEETQKEVSGIKKSK